MRPSLALAAISLASGASFAAGHKPAPGEVAPPFSLESSTGKTVSLSDYKGRSVVLAFFVKANTSG
ncbi:MAG TPA: redoxin domain-containing protein [Myxococcales bacterium]|jgi:cytochrome oxidase Cu insertion factor (SCO1/SenC/PrrC family)|nr:redoxin domain-containing protein [Myxococcales bacterium]